MKKSMIAVLLMFGLVATSSVFACENGHSSKSSGSTPPAATTK